MRPSPSSPTAPTTSRERSPTSRRPPGQPLRRLARRARRELDMDELRRLLRAAARPTRNCPHLPALDRRLPGRLGAADRGRPRRRLDPPRGRHLRHRRGRPPGARPARRARRRRARRGDRRRNGLRRSRHAGARGRGRGPGGRRQRRSPRACARREVAADLVLPRHARVPAAGRADRQGPGLARRHPEDQADPVAGVRDHPRRAGAHRRRAPSSAWSTTRASCSDAGADGWVVQHIQAPEQAERLVERGRELFDSEPLLVSEVGPVIGTYTGPGLIGVGGRPALAAAPEPEL